MLDKKLGGGFKSMGAYLVASEKKAGKSSLMRKFIFNFLSLGRTVFLLDLEESIQDIFRTMTAIAKEKSFASVDTKDFNNIEPLLENFGYLDSMLSISELYKDGEFDTLALDNLIKRQVTLGVEIIIFDNVTRIGAENSYNARMKVMADLARLAKECGVLIFVVGHTPSTEIETLDKNTITEAITTGQFEKLFSDVYNIVQRPKDPYGGSVTSQFDGVLNLWRPMQYFEKASLQSVSWLVVDQIRHAPPFRIRLEYIGDQRNFKFVGSTAERDNASFIKGWEQV